MSDDKKKFDMRGYFAKNSRKSKPTHPDWMGKIRVNDQEFWLSAWFKDGNPDLMNVSVTDPATLPGRDPNKENTNNERGQSQTTQNQTDSGSSDDGDPFGDIFSSLP